MQEVHRILNQRVKDYLDPVIREAYLSDPDIDITDFSLILTGELEEHGLIRESNAFVVELIRKYVNDFVESL